MPTYTLTNLSTGKRIGQYQADTAEQALDVYCKSEGYADRLHWAHVMTTGGPRLQTEAGECVNMAVDADTRKPIRELTDTEYRRYVKLLALCQAAPGCGTVDGEMVADDLQGRAVVVE